MDINIIKEKGPFFRAKVMINQDDRMDGRIGVYIPEFHSHLSNEEAGMQKMILGEASSKSYITAAPMLEINQSKIDTAVYQTNSGNYNVPRQGSYVLVFFLNNDPQQCFYFPKGFSLPYPDQRIQGMNLDLKDKIDFADVSAKPNMDLREFFNGTISGWNLNDENNEYFLIFDNGTEIRLGSPIEPAKAGSIRKSHRTQPSFLKLLIQRKDSLYRIINDIAATQKTASWNVIVEQQKNSQGGLNGNFPEESGETSSSASQSMDVTEKGSSSTKILTQNSPERKLDILESITVTSKEISTSNSASVVLEDSADSTTVEATTEFNEDTYTTEQKTEIIKAGETAEKLTIIEKLSATKNNLAKVQSSLMIEKDKQTSEERFFSQEPNNIKDLHSSILLDEKTKESGSLKVSKTVNKESVELLIEGKQNSEQDPDKWREFSSGYQILKDTISVFQEVREDNLVSSLSISSEKDKAHKISLSTGYQVPSIDPSNTLNLPPISERGFNLELSAEEKLSKFSLTPYGRVNGVESAALPVSGGPSKLEWEHDGAEHTITIELKNRNPLAGIKLILNTSDNSVVLEVPSGDVSVKAPLGTVSVESKTAIISTTQKVEVKSALEAIISAGRVKVEGAMSAEVSATMATVRAASRLLLDAPIINLGEGSVNPLVLGLPLLAWMVSHIHIATAMGSPTTPAVVPPPANMLSMSVLAR
jgi:hypothetical protein